MRSNKAAMGILGGVLVLVGELHAQASFVRGDYNWFTGVEISDALAIKNLLFYGVSNGCEDAGDANDDGSIDLSDQVTILSHLFQGGPALPAPSGSAGSDPTADGLTCSDYSEGPPLESAARFGFDCPPSPVDVEPGIQQDFVIDVLLELGEISSGDELEAWSLGVTVTGADMKSATLSGLTVSTIHDDDWSPLSPPVDPHPVNLALAGFSHFYRVSEQRAVVSAVVLDLSKKTYLHPGSTETVLRLTLTATTPSAGSTTEILLTFEDGIAGAGQPVENLVAIGGVPFHPAAEECRFTLRGVAPAGSAYIRGDANNNGKVNLADAVWIVNDLFRGGPGTACRDAADPDHSLNINLTDAIYIINHQLLGGPPPPAPFPGCGGVGEEVGSCPQGSTICP